MTTTTKLHITTTAPEGLKVKLVIDHKTETVVAQCEDSTGKWTKHFDALWECGQWVRSFLGPVVPEFTLGPYRAVHYPQQQAAA